MYHLYIGRTTVYGKLTAEKSGDGAKVLSDCEQWTIDNFHFLKGHITRLTGCTIASVSIKNLFLYVQ